MAIKYQRHNNMLETMKQNDKKIECCGFKPYYGVWMMIMLFSIELSIHLLNYYHELKHEEAYITDRYWITLTKEER